VSGVLGIRWFDCTVTGMEAHAGPTPMALRKDALQVATHLMQEVVAAALRHKEGRRAWFAQRLTDMGLADPDGRAAELLTIWDGALASAVIVRDGSPARAAARLARRVLQA
jgi:acetylornithine deacetylase/succinyl-diaminopimelate desuccinylase-like protein